MNLKVNFFPFARKFFHDDTDSLSISTAKRTRDRISSEAAENTAMIIGIVAGALIAVILVVLLVLKFVNRSNSNYKVDERKNFGKSPSHSNSNAALLNTNVAAAAAAAAAAGGRGGDVGTIGCKVPLNNPTMGTLEKKPIPSKKTGKDIKEWYV